MVSVARIVFYKCAVSLIKLPVGKKSVCRSWVYTVEMSLSIDFLCAECAAPDTDFRQVTVEPSCIVI